MSDSVQPRDFELDWDNVPLEAEEGRYNARCAACKLLATKDKHYPMLVLEWELTSGAEGSPDPDEGAKVTDFVVIMPPDDKQNHRRSIQNMQRLAKACGVATADLPRSFGPETKDAWKAAFEGREAVVKVSHKANRGESEKRVRINY